MATHVNYSGLVIAGVGFLLTRFTVTLAIYESPVRFYLSGVVPLVLGLGLAAFGVALAVADVDPSFVRTTALWCVVGTGAMLVLVVITLLGSTMESVSSIETVRSRVSFSTFLIGGSIGGTLTGLYAARNRRQRDELRQHARRLAVLNRLLRHEVLNAVTVIRGYAANGDDGNADAAAVIEEYAAGIEETIEEVKHLTRDVGETGTPDDVVDLRACLDRSVDVVREQFPAARISVRNAADEVHVRADGNLEQVFVDLIENAVVHSTAAEPTVDVGVSVEGTQVRVAVSDDGPGLPESQQALLETGRINRYDDPGAGFGLNVVRILVERYGGRIETDVEPSGSTVTVDLALATDEGVAVRESRSSVAGVRPSVPHLAVTFGAAILAGVVYGVAAEQLGGSVAFIGVYYGIQDPVVGWLTHEFHSVVFAFVFAGLVSLVPVRRRSHVPTVVAIGVGWGFVLWFVAAGFVSPIWLRLLEFQATIPSLSGMLLVTHLSWGASLGFLSGLGYRRVALRRARIGAPAARDSDPT